MTTKQILEKQLGHGADYQTQRYFVTLPEGHTLEDLFEPTYWAQVVQQNKLRQFDLIRVRANDGSFDTQITVISVLKGAALVELWPKVPAAAAELMKPRSKSVVPIAFGGLPKSRVEEIGGVVPDGKKFRILAINQQELSRHASRGEADGAHAHYLASLNMRMPSNEEIGAAVAQMEADEDRRVAAVDAKRNKGKKESA